MLNLWNDSSISGREQDAEVLALDALLSDVVLPRVPKLVVDPADLHFPIFEWVLGGVQGLAAELGPPLTSDDDKEGQCNILL